MINEFNKYIYIQNNNNNKSGNNKYYRIIIIHDHLYALCQFNSSVALYYNLSKFNQNLSKNKLPGLLPQGRERFPVFPKISPKNVVFTPKMQFMEPES